MAVNNNISQELNELGSSLLKADNQPVYSVPAGYFGGLAGEVLRRIRAMEAASAREELAHLSPLLSGIDKTMPYQVPVGYFAGIEEQMLYAMTVNDQSADEELETLSPLLAGLNKEMPFAVPQGYFDTVAIPVAEETKPAKVIGIGGRKWFKLAAAAVVLGIVATSAFFILRKPVTKDALVRFEGDVNKMNDTQKENVAQYLDAGLTGTEIVVGPDKTNEIKELLKDISDEELKDFQQQNEDIEDILLTASE